MWILDRSIFTYKGATAFLFFYLGAGSILCSPNMSGFDVSHIASRFDYWVFFNRLPRIIFGEGDTSLLWVTE